MSLESAFNAMSEAAKPRDSQAPKRLRVETAKPTVKLPKNNDPAFEKTTVYMRGDLKLAAWHKWKAAKGGDLSDLVNKLLSEYLNG